MYPHEWNKIALHVPTKTSAQIKKRFVDYLRKRILNEAHGSDSSKDQTIQLVEEIQDGVGTLIDPLGNFFRQKLQLIKTSSMNVSEPSSKIFQKS